jgi:hypothetical protein
MKIEFEKYGDYAARVPKNGKHILAYGNDEAIVVYQAFRHEIATYAIVNQHLGGPGYSFDRMSWIKPNFLWMMYRCGWGTKPGQERILAIWIRKTFFETILQQAVYSSFHNEIYQSEEKWKTDLRAKEVRVQWDPDHDPHGRKQERRAIQLGMKGNILKEFAQSQILQIDDLSEIIGQQRALLENNVNELLVPKETIFIPSSDKIIFHLGITK